MQSKGNGVKIPQPGQGDKSLRGLKRGNANELGDVSESPGKSFLFFLRDGLPGIGSTGDRVRCSRKTPRLLWRPVRSRLALENPREAK